MCQCPSSARMRASGIGEGTSAAFGLQRTQYAPVNGVLDAKRPRCEVHVFPTKPENLPDPKTGENPDHRNRSRCLSDLCNDCPKRNRQLPVAMLASAREELCSLERNDGPLAAPHAARMKIIRDQTTPRKRPSRWVE